MAKRTSGTPSASGGHRTAAAGNLVIADEPLQRTLPETVTLVTSVLLLGALAYSVNAVFSPFVVIGALIYLLYPLRKNPLPRRLMWLGIFLFLLWFFYSILGLIAPFLLAFLIAYIMNPLVSLLENRRVPRWVSSLVLVLLMIGVVVAIILFGMPPAIQQFQGIINGLSTIVSDFAALLQSGALFRILAGYGIPVEKAQEVITQQVSPRLESILKTLFEGLFGFVSSVSSVVLHLINAIIVPFLVFYLLKDFPVITERFAKLVPRARRDRFVGFGRKVDHLMGRYFRGAITVAIIQGTISTIGLTIIGVDYALVLGIMSGILDFIPYLGLLSSLIVSCIVALFSGGPVAVKAIAVVALYLSQKLLEATVLGPKIIGAQVGLHPVLLILCLMVFGYFLGFIGLLIAVPTTALIIAVVKEWEENRRSLQQTPLQ